MGTHRSQSISKLLGDASVILYNARHDPEIRAALLPYHYDEAKLNQGLALYETAQDLHTLKTSKYSEQYGATQALQTSWKETHRTFAYHRTLAKQIFKNDRKHQTSLSLDGRIPLKFSHWIGQAAGFYQNILENPETLDAIQAHIAINRSEFETTRDAIAHLQTLNSHQEHTKALAQSATQERDEALQALKNYLDQLKVVARYALRGNQKLELILRRPIP